jgi:hypothetical protein
VTAAGGRKIVLLAALAVLAVAIAIAVGRGGGGEAASSLPPGAGPWMPALAGVYTPPARTACGVRVGRHTLGVSHPVLPCGVKLYLRYGHVTVLATVIDNGDVRSGRLFDVTPALASLLGLEGVAQVAWRFTR